jgi:hypothetical protein
MQICKEQKKKNANKQTYRGVKPVLVSYDDSYTER